MRGPRRASLRPRGDDGATAILTALLAVVLFGVCALAVDLTNAFARRAASQSTADQAARDAAMALPDACAALVAAVASLAAVPNDVIDDTSPVPLAVPQVIGDVASYWTNGDDTDGEVTVLGADVNADGAPDPISTASCGAPGASPRGSAVRVWSPRATVQFGLGALAGASSVDVQSTGTARLVSALPVLPLALPEACSDSGPATFVLRSPGSLSAPIPPVPLPGSSPAAPIAVVGGVTGTQLTLAVSADPRVGPVSYWVRWSADTDRGPATADVLSPAVDVGVIPGIRSVTTDIPDRVRIDPGVWVVQVSRADPPPTPSPPMDSEWSVPVPVTVTSPVGAAPVCDTTGLFGQVLSLVASPPPATPPPATSDPRVAMRDGLGYEVGPTVVARSAASQDSLATSIESGLFDRLARQGAPCPSGNLLPAWQGGSFPLVRATNTVSCYEAVTEADPMTGRLVWRINDPDVVADPRLFVIPVVSLPTGTRPADDTDVPVVGYRLAYITTETPQSVANGTPVAPCLTTARSCNGVELGPTGSLDRLQLYIFEAGQLPVSIATTTNGHPLSAGPVDVTLAE